MAHNPLGPVNLGPASTPSSASTQPSKTRTWFRDNWRGVLKWGAGLAVVGALGSEVYDEVSRREGEVTTTSNNTEPYRLREQVRSDARAAYESAGREEVIMQGLMQAGKGWEDAELMRHYSARLAHGRTCLTNLAQLFGKQDTATDGGVLSWGQWAQAQHENGSLNQDLSAFDLYQAGMSLIFTANPQDAHQVGLLMLAEIRTKGWADFAKDEITCGVSGDERSPNYLDRFIIRHLVNADEVTPADRASLAAYCATLNSSATTPDASMSGQDAAVTVPTDSGTETSQDASTDTAVAADVSVQIPNDASAAPEPTDAASQAVNDASAAPTATDAQVQE